MTTREVGTPEDSDFIEHLFTASTHDYLISSRTRAAFMWSASTRFPTWAARRKGAASRTCSN